jgi:spore coat polysaccharide biosynthesis protein SpsF
MTGPRIGAIVQARMGSTRLPGKVLLPAAGKPLLEILLERLSACRSLEQRIVATSIDRRDAPIAELADRVGVPVFRGSEQDVLDRYYRAAVHHGLDLVVRVTSDCPLVDPALVDRMVELALAHHGEFDLVTNRHPLTYPDGLDLDVIPMSSLRHAWTHATEPHQREHTIPYFWEAGLRVHNVEDPERGFQRHRWTLDYAEDYELIRAILEALYRPGQIFHAADVLAYLAEHPELSALNAKYLPQAVAA